MKVKEDGKEAKDHEEEARDEQARKEWIKEKLKEHDEALQDLVISEAVVNSQEPEAINERVTKLKEQAGGKEYEPKALHKQACKELKEEAKRKAMDELKAISKEIEAKIKDEPDAPKDKGMQKVEALKRLTTIYIDRLKKAKKDITEITDYKGIASNLAFIQIHETANALTEEYDENTSPLSAGNIRSTLYLFPMVKASDIKRAFSLSSGFLQLDNKKRKVKNNLTNAVIYLMNDLNLTKSIYYDEIEACIKVKNNLPWRAYLNEKESGRWTDFDLNELQIYSDSFYNITNSKHIEVALNKIANDNKVHPIKELILSKPWDGEKRIKYLLPDFLGTEANNYTEAAITDQLVAAVGRVFSPGIKWDNVLVFYGNQGVGKSSFIRALACDKWINESITTMEGVRGMEQLRGAWLVELPELSAMKKSEVEQVKAYLSKQVDKYRPAYGTYEIEQPRQCVFFGTTNKLEILKDTENRRFIIVECGVNEATREIHGLIPSRVSDYDDRKKVRAYVQQIWAEAYHIFEKQGFILKQSKYTKGDYLEEQQSKFIEVSEYYEPLEKYILTPVPLDFDEYDDARKRGYYQSLNDFNKNNPNSAISELVECAPCGYLNAGTYALPEHLRYLTRVSISEFMKCFLCIEDKDKDRKRISIAIGKALRQMNKLSTDIRVSKEIKNMRCEDGTTRKAVEVYRVADNKPRLGGVEYIEDVEDYDYNLKQKGLI